MLSLDHQLEINGVTIYRDLQNEQQYFCLPTEKARIAENGKGLQFVAYIDDEIQEGTDPDFGDDINRSGGFLTLEVALGPSASEMNTLLEELQSLKGNDVQLSRVPFIDGGVQLFLFGRGKDSSDNNAADVSIAGSTKPSLYGNQTAVFSVRLGGMEAQIMWNLLKDSTQTQASVVYDLEFHGMMPAYHLEIIVDFKATEEYWRHNVTADFNLRGQQLAIAASTDIDLMMRDLVNSGDITVKEINFREGDSSSILGPDDPTGMKLVKELISPMLFNPTAIPSMDYSAIDEIRDRDDDSDDDDDSDSDDGNDTRNLDGNGDVNRGETDEDREQDNNDGNGDQGGNSGGGGGAPPNDPPDDDEDSGGGAAGGGAGGNGDDNEDANDDNSGNEDDNDDSNEDGDSDEENNDDDGDDNEDADDDNNSGNDDDDDDSNEDSDSDEENDDDDDGDDTDNGDDGDENEDDGEQGGDSEQDDDDDSNDDSDDDEDDSDDDDEDSDDDEEDPEGERTSNANFNFNANIGYTMKHRSISQQIKRKFVFDRISAIKNTIHPGGALSIDGTNFNHDEQVQLVRLGSGPFQQIDLEIRSALDFEQYRIQEAIVHVSYGYKETVGDKDNMKEHDSFLVNPTKPRTFVSIPVDDFGTLTYDYYVEFIHEPGSIIGTHQTKIQSRKFEDVTERDIAVNIDDHSPLMPVEIQVGSLQFSDEGIQSAQIFLAPNEETNGRTAVLRSDSPPVNKFLIQPADADTLEYYKKETFFYEGEPIEVESSEQKDTQVIVNTPRSKLYTIAPNLVDPAQLVDQALIDVRYVNADDVERKATIRLDQENKRKEFVIRVEDDDPRSWFGKARYILTNGEILTTEEANFDVAEQIFSLQSTGFRVFKVSTLLRDATFTGNISAIEVEITTIGDDATTLETIILHQAELEKIVILQDAPVDENLNAITRIFRSDGSQEELSFPINPTQDELLLRITAINN